MNDTADIKIELPKGFERVDAALDLPPAVEWEIGVAFTGKVKRVQTLKIRTKEGTKETRALVCDTEHGPRTVWESAGLKGVFEMAQVGQTWWLCYVEDRDTGQPSPMKVFQAGLRRA